MVPSVQDDPPVPPSRVPTSELWSQHRLLVIHVTPPAAKQHADRHGLGLLMNTHGSLATSHGAGREGEMLHLFEPL